MENLSKKIKAEERTGAIAVGDDEIEKSDNYGSDGGEKDEVKKLLKPFSAGQVFDILCDAAMKDAQLLHNIRKLADKNLPHKNIFIDGLHSKTTEETLHSIFSQYGELEECTVVMDDELEKSEGCAFVTYKHLDGAERALKYPCKKIDSRRTLSRLASDEQEQAQAEAVALSQKNVRRRKIFVGNVPVYMSCLKLINHFSLYGEIEEGQLGFDSKSGKLKANVAFTYKNVEGAKKALEEPDKYVCGHYMHCTRVAKKHKQKEDGQNVPVDRSGRAVTHGKDSNMGPDTVGIPHPNWFDDSELDMGFSNLATGASSSQHDAKALQWDSSFPELTKGASSSQHHAKFGQWQLDPPHLPIGAFFSQNHAKALQLTVPSVPLQTYLESHPIAGLNTHKYGVLSGFKYDYSSHAAQQLQDFYQNQQVSQAAAPDLPDLNAPDYIYDTQVTEDGKNAYQYQQLSQAAAPVLPDLIVPSHVYDSLATKEEKNASENQQLSLSTLQALLEPIAHQIQETGLQQLTQSTLQALLKPIAHQIQETGLQQLTQSTLQALLEPIAHQIQETDLQQLTESILQALLEPIAQQIQETGLQAIHQTQQYQQSAYQFEQASVQASHQTQQVQQSACQFEQPSVQAIHQAQQDQQTAYQIQPPPQLMLTEQTGQPPAPALQKEHNQSQLLFPRRSQQ